MSICPVAEPVEAPGPCRLPGRSLSLSMSRTEPPTLIPGLTRNLPHVIPGLAGNLSKQPAVTQSLWPENK